MQIGSCQLTLLLIAILCFFSVFSSGCAVKAASETTAKNSERITRVENSKAEIAKSSNLKSPAPARLEPDDSIWIGKFESHQKVIADPADNELEIKRQGNKLTAVYEDILGGTIDYYFTATVEINGDTATFYYDQCLTKVGVDGFEGTTENDAMYPCSEVTYKKGDLMFKLIKTVHKNRKISFKKNPVKFDHLDIDDDFYKVKN